MNNKNDEQKKEVTLFSMAQFTSQAEEIERRRAKNGDGNKLPNLFRGLKDLPQFTTAMRTPVGNFTEKIDIGENLSPATCKSTEWRLVKEFIPTPPPISEGWFIYVSSEKVWLFLDQPPRLILPRQFAFSWN